ncbi:MAG: hydrogenase iron-sulfur subunit [Bacteroidales bacterium]
MDNHTNILVFSTEKISDPAIDLAGLLKKHYPASVVTISLPCSSAVKPRWILRAFDKGFNGVFIAADGTDCPYSNECSENTSAIVNKAQEMMKDKGLDPARLKMAAICSVCAEAFVKHMLAFVKSLSEEQEN